jgi:hypothetical protein
VSAVSKPFDNQARDVLIGEKAHHSAASTLSCCI